MQWCVLLCNFFINCCLSLFLLPYYQAKSCTLSTFPFVFWDSILYMHVISLPCFLSVPFACCPVAWAPCRGLISVSSHFISVLSSPALCPLVSFLCGLGTSPQLAFVSQLLPFHCSFLLLLFNIHHCQHHTNAAGEDLRLNYEAVLSCRHQGGAERRPGSASIISL